MKKIINVMLFVFCCAIMKAQTITQVNEWRKRDSAMAAQKINSLTTEVTALKNANIEFDQAFSVVGTKVIGKATPQFIDSTRKKLFGSTGTGGSNVPQSLIDSMRAYIRDQNALKETVFRHETDISALSKSVSQITTNIASLEQSFNQYNGRITTLEANSQTFNNRLTDSCKSLRDGINSQATRYSQLNTTVWKNNDTQLKVNDTLLTAIANTSGNFSQYDVRLKTIESANALLKTDVEDCKKYDALLQRTTLSLPPKP